MLGERFVNSRCESIIDSDVLNLKKTSCKVLIEKSPKKLDNDNIASIMMTLHNVLCSCVYSNSPLQAFILTYVVQSLLVHGVSECLLIGFSIFASVLTSQGDRLSYDVGKMSMGLLDKTQTKENML